MKTWIRFSMVMVLCLTVVSRAEAAGWQERFTTVTFSVISSENEADRVARHQKMIAYLETRFGTKVKMHVATEYAGTIEAIRSEKAEFANFGPASYAAAWEVTGGNVEAVLAGTDAAGNLGYYSVIAVKASGSYKTLDDLKGKKFAFADPNSTSGFLVPSFYLKRQGYPPETFFDKTGFSGSHENSILAVLNGTYDACATFWNDDTMGAVARMEDKGMIPKGSIRYVWKSPKLPGDPVWTVRKNLPVQMKADIKAALLNMPTLDPAAWKDLTGAKYKTLKEVSHADYLDIIAMRQENLKERKAK